MEITISCPGKIILMGEHAVVYGKPAIVAAVNRKMTISYNTEPACRQAGHGAHNTEITAKIKSQIPIGCGMGSSAALSVIMATSHMALNGKTELNNMVLAKINQIAHENEKIYHVNSSGVDPAICTYGGVLWYRKTKKGKIFKKLNFKKLPKFVLINSGKPKESTGEMVEKIKYKVESRKYKAETLKLFDEIERQTKIFLQALTLSSLRAERSNLIKNCIQNCEMCLEDMGVVGDLAKRVVREIEQIGGAAKISGAGGIKKGSGILLCYHQEPQKILDLAEKLELESYKVKLGEEGVKLE